MKPETYKDKWLMEIGVIGIDKLLLWMRKTQWTPLEIEHVLRLWAFNGLPTGNKTNLPFREIEPSERKINQDSINFLLSALNEDEKTKKLKGKKDGKNRVGLVRWRMDRKTADLIRLGSSDSDDRKRLARIYAHSQILGDALLVTTGKLKHIPEKYPLLVERHLTLIDRTKVQMIIKKSIKTIVDRIALHMFFINFNKKMIVKHDRDRVHLLAKLDKERAAMVDDIAIHESVLKKWGQGLGI